MNFPKVCSLHANHYKIYQKKTFLSHQITHVHLLATRSVAATFSSGLTKLRKHQPIMGTKAGGPRRTRKNGPLTINLYVKSSTPSATNPMAVTRVTGNRTREHRASPSLHLSSCELANRLYTILSSWKETGLIPSFSIYRLQHLSKHRRQPQ